MNQKTLHEYARDFIDTKRAAGMLYKSGEYGLNRYLKYHEKEFNDCTYPTKESVHDYFGTFANLYCSITSPVIDFCKYLRYLDIPAYVYRSKIIIPQARAPYMIHPPKVFFGLQISILSIFSGKMTIREGRSEFAIIPNVFSLIL